MAHGGRSLRWRLLFRSDHLAGLSETDRAHLAGLGLSTALDFRGLEESAAEPYELPGVQRVSLAIEPTVVQRMQDLAQAGQALTGPRVAALMCDLYRSLVNDQSPRFAEFFEHLLAARGGVVFHCTAGKDRTGLAAALLLLALGVPRAVVLEDYLITNEVFRAPTVVRSEIPAEALAVLWRVQRDFLDTALDAIEADHGGLQRYLRHRLRLSHAALQALAERYLAPA